MTRVVTHTDSPEVRELEISARDERSFWIGWVLVTSLLCAFSWKGLPSLTLLSLPLWVLWAIVFAVFQLRGWMGIFWSRDGKEVLKVFSVRLQYYSTGGTKFDQRTLDYPLDPTESPKVEVLTFGLGTNGIQNRIHIRTQSGSLYFGRRLSSEDAKAVQKIVSDWLRPSSRLPK